jgi:hypothetical protein
MGQPSQELDLGRHQLVAESGHCHDALGVGVVAFDLSAQRRHVRVAGSLVCDVGALPEMLHDLAAGEDSSGFFGEKSKQLVLGRAARNRLAVSLHFVLDDVDVNPRSRRTVESPMGSNSRRRRIARTRLKSSTSEPGLVM